MVCGKIERGEFLLRNFVRSKFEQSECEGSEFQFVSGASVSRVSAE